MAVPAASVGATQHERPQDPLGCSTTFLAASARPDPVLEAWDGQTQVSWRFQGLACAGWPGDVRWEPHPVRLSFMRCYCMFLCVVIRKRMSLLFVWGYCGVFGHRSIFQTLVVAMSRCGFISSCASLGVDLRASYLVGSYPVLVGVPPFPGVT